ncbi:thymidine kinase [bacterium]|nr:thymidine kinase [bacterium]
MIQYSGRQTGAIEVVCGPMFSGKTEETIRRIRLALIAKQKIQIFKHSIDDRYDNCCLMSHTSVRLDAIPVKTSDEIMKKIKDSTRVVGIDEAQFFDEDISKVCEKLANRGLRVIVAGLDQDSKGNPFGFMPQLMAIADSVLKLKSVCMVCGGWASKSQRLTDDDQQVVVGSGEIYEARCRACFDPDLSLEKAIPIRPRSKKKEEKEMPISQ